MTKAIITILIIPPQKPNFIIARIPKRPDIVSVAKHPLLSFPDII